MLPTTLLSLGALLVAHAAAAAALDSQNERMVTLKKRQAIPYYPPDVRPFPINQPIGNGDAVPFAVIPAGAAAAAAFPAAVLPIAAVPAAAVVYGAAGAIIGTGPSSAGSGGCNGRKQVNGIEQRDTCTPGGGGTGGGSGGGGNNGTNPGGGGTGGGGSNNCPSSYGPAQQNAVSTLLSLAGTLERRRDFHEPDIAAREGPALSEQMRALTRRAGCDDNAKKAAHCVLLIEWQLASGLYSTWQSKDASSFAKNSDSLLSILKQYQNGIDNVLGSDGAKKYDGVVQLYQCAVDHRGDSGFYN